MSDEQREALAGAAPEAKLRFRLGEALPSGRGGALPFPQLLPAEMVTEEDMAWADAILGNVQPALLQKAGRLQWLQTSSAGDGSGVSCRMDTDEITNISELLDI